MIARGDIPDYSATLLRAYNTFEIIERPVEETHHYYTEAIRHKQEDRAYLVWALIYTSPYSKDVPEFEEFRRRKKEKPKKKSLGMQI